MTYNVLMGTLNPTHSLYAIPGCFWGDVSRRGALSSVHMYLWGKLHPAHASISLPHHAGSCWPALASSAPANHLQDGGACVEVPA